MTSFALAEINTLKVLTADIKKNRLFYIIIIIL